MAFPVAPTALLRMVAQSLVCFLAAAVCVAGGGPAPQAAATSAPPHAPLDSAGSPAWQSGVRAPSRGVIFSAPHVPGSPEILPAERLPAAGGPSGAAPAKTTPVIRPSARSTLPPLGRLPADDPVGAPPASRSLPLRWVQLPVDDRSVDSLTVRADELVRSGFRLGHRGAFYSARSEFIQSLRLIAQALDAPAGGTAHGTALACGLQALREAEDFTPRGMAVPGDLDLRAIVAGHRTAVLKDVPGLEQISVLDAQRSYSTYGQEQLAAAAGHLPAASMALYGLACVETTLAARDPHRYPLAESKALCLYQAALMIRPDNYMAANELGVLLAHQGRYEDAQQVLRHAVEIAPTRAGLNNLAVVWERLGQDQLAAELRGQALRQSGGQVGRLGAADDHSGGAVTWLEPQQFARTAAEKPRAPAQPAARRSERPRPAQRAPAWGGWPWR